MQLLSEGWPDEDVNGPQPVVWSPAASSWGAILNQRLSEQGEPAMATPAEPFMLTPLVIAMPEPMADALGYPETPIGYADILRLANDPQGWGAYGHPEWGPFRLGKTNPNFSTSALSSTIAQYYAATGKTSDLSLEDLDRPEVQAVRAGVESAIVHYGDITMTFLNNWFRNDVRGTSLTYVSAVAVEEKSVIDYNKGNPDGTLSPGEEPREPRVPLVAVYPKEGTLYSDNPFIVLDAPWVDDTERAGALALRGVHQAARSTERGCSSSASGPATSTCRSANRSAPSGASTPNQPQTLLEVPAAAGAHRAARPVGPGPQARPRHAPPRRVGIDGRSGRSRRLGDTDEARPREGSGRRRARRVRARRRRRPADLHHRPRAEPGPRLARSRARSLRWPVSGRRSRARSPT